MSQKWSPRCIELNLICRWCLLWWIVMNCLHNNAFVSPVRWCVAEPQFCPKTSSCRMVMVLSTLDFNFTAVFFFQFFHPPWNIDNAKLAYIATFHQCSVANFGKMCSAWSDASRVLVGSPWSVSFAPPLLQLFGACHGGSKANCEGRTRRAWNATCQKLPDFFF